jgi:hypothetical protein
MTLQQIMHRAIDMGEDASKLADMPLRQPNHELHRVGVSLRDLSLSIAQSLTSLSYETRKKIGQCLVAFSLSLEFVAHLGAIERDLKPAGEGIMAEWCVAVRDNARDAIGTYWRPSAVGRNGIMYSPREPSPAATRSGFITATAKRGETLGGR